MALKDDPNVQNTYKAIQDLDPETKDEALLAMVILYAQFEKMPIVGDAFKIHTALLGLNEIIHSLASKMNSAMKADTQITNERN